MVDSEKVEGIIEALRILMDKCKDIQDILRETL